MLNRRMRRMWLVTQSVEKQHIQILQLRQGSLRNVIMVGQIRSRPEAKSINLCVAVNHNHRLKPRTEQIQRALDVFQFNMWQSAELIVRVENVAEHSADELGGIGM